MADFFESITDEQADLIETASLFFIASAHPQLTSDIKGAGPVNISPKGGVKLHIIDRNHVAYLDYTGSGNETARHALAGGPITIMTVAFDATNAAIVRLYGTASVTALADSPFADLLLATSTAEINLPERQVIEIHIDKTMTSCGYGVPVMEFIQERTTGQRGRRYKLRKVATS